MSLKEKIQQLKNKGYFTCSTCYYNSNCETDNILCIEYVSDDLLYGNITNIATIKNSVKSNFKYTCQNCGEKFNTPSIQNNMLVCLTCKSSNIIKLKKSRKRKGD